MAHPQAPPPKKKQSTHTAHTKAIICGGRRTGQWSDVINGGFQSISSTEENFSDVVYRGSVVIDGGFSATSSLGQDFSDIVYRGEVAVDGEICNDVVFRGGSDVVSGRFSATSSKVENFSCGVY